MNNKSVLEIFVDKLNEKGPGAFEHILIILHKIIEKQKKHFFSRTKYLRPEFSFEISKIGNKIRFFVIVEENYKTFFKNQIYAHYSNVEIVEIPDYLQNIPNNKFIGGTLELKNHYLFPIKTFTQIQETSTGDTIDPFSSITASLSKTGNNTLNVFQINFSPYPDEFWKDKVERTFNILNSKNPKFLKNILIKYKFNFLKVLLFPIFLFYKLIVLLFNKQEETKEESKENIIPLEVKNKSEHFAYGVNINILSAGEDMIQNKLNLKEIISTLGVFSNPGFNEFQIGYNGDNIDFFKNTKNRKSNDKMILSTQELSGLVHLPTSYVKTPGVNWVLARNFEPPSNLPLVNLEETEKSDLTPIGTTNFRAEEKTFGIGPSDRRRHMYIIGKTGMGKSTLLENMIIDDIRKGRGVAVIDPHGDLAENVIGHIPKSRTNGTIIFDPSDTNCPIAFNMLDGVTPEHRPLVASGLVSIFKKIFGDSWGPRLEHTLRNTILALLEYPGTTLISIPLMLTSDYYRAKVIEKITDPVVKKFWTGEFEKMQPAQKVETAGPILNKVGQFLSSSILRNVLGQAKNSFSMRWAMDNGKIVIINLSKGKIGEDASSLLGAMMVTKFQMDAMSRADIAERDRKDFYLYVDEFQNFATDSFATILSEARKYKLNLVMANQYIDQMTETVKGAVFGNVGSTVSFQVGYHDSTILKDVMGGGDITSEDLTNLRKYSIYIKQLIDGMPSKVFSADTFGPYQTDSEIFQTRYSKILSVSREKYGTPKEIVEQKIFKMMKEVEEQEQKMEEYKNKIKKQKEDEKEKKRLEYLKNEGK